MLAEPSPAIAAVIGTRPEAIKMAPVLRALDAKGLDCALICTGQHAALDLAGAGIDRQADAWLPLDFAGADPDAMCDRIEALVHDWLARSSARLVIVQGDTNSALGAARAAHALAIPVAHVEAGLRTFDLSNPWPEERNRIEIDAIADLLFAPTPAAVTNLRREELPGRVALSGNTGIDAVLDVASRAVRSLRSGRKHMILATVHRRENRGAGIAAIGAALRRIGERGDVDIVIPLHPNAGARAEMIAAAGSTRGVTLIEPQGFAAMVDLLLACDLVLTDSGGLQEEAPALGRPVLILRSTTERREAIDAGNAILVGTDPARIILETLRLIDDDAARARMSVPAFPFGTGGAGPIIANAIGAFLGHGVRPAIRPELRTERTQS